jgi:hypothetical protein
MSLASSAPRRMVSSSSSAAKSGNLAVAVAAARGRRRLRAKADLHGLVASSGALFAPPLASGSSTPAQRPGSPTLGGAAADPSKRAAFAAVLHGALGFLVLGGSAEASAAGSGSSGSGSGSSMRPVTPLLIPPEVLEADAQLAEEESGGGWGKSHIADRLAMQPVSRFARQSGGGDH